MHLKTEQLSNWGSFENLRKNLHSFFSESWRKNKQYSYVIYLAKKCLNLNEIFFAADLKILQDKLSYEAAELIQSRETAFLAQGGLLLKCKDLVRHYLEHGNFPRLLILDELCLSGGGFSELMYSLEKAVRAAYEELTQRKLDSGSLIDLRDNLFAAVDFRPYIADARGLFLEKDLLNQVKSSTKAYSDTWFPYIQYVSQTITNDPIVENTAVIPTFRIEKETFDGLAYALNRDETWFRSDWKDHSQRPTTVIYQRSCCQKSDRVTAHFALRCRYDKASGLYFVTPYVLWNTFIGGHFQEFCQNVSSLFREKDLNELSSFFEFNYPVLRSVQMQLFASIGSMLLFFNLLKRYGCWLPDGWDVRKNSDLEKIAQNFGTIQAVCPNFDKICDVQDNQDIRGALTDLYSHLLLKHTSVLGIDGGNDFRHPQGAYMFHGRKHSLESERAELNIQNFRRKNNILYAPWSINSNEKTIGFSDYLNCFPPDYCSFNLKIAALLVIFQQGIVGQHIYAREGDNGYLNVGESTLVLAFEPLFDYLPALVKLENYCLQRNLDMIGWAKLFGRYLAEEKNGILLSDLFKEYIAIIYEGGYLLSNWPLELLEPDEGNDQNNYLEQLNSFLNLFQ